VSLSPPTHPAWKRSHHICPLVQVGPVRREKLPPLGVKVIRKLRGSARCRCDTALHHPPEDGRWVEKHDTVFRPVGEADHLRAHLRECCCPLQGIAWVVHSFQESTRGSSRIQTTTPAPGAVSCAGLLFRSNRICASARLREAQGASSVPLAPSEPCAKSQWSRQVPGSQAHVERVDEELHCEGVGGCQVDRAVLHAASEQCELLRHFRASP